MRTMDDGFYKLLSWIQDRYLMQSPDLFPMFSDSLK